MQQAEWCYYCLV